MKRIILCLALCFICSNAWAVSWSSTQTGTWSVTSNLAASPWYDGGTQTARASIPANTDTVTIVATHTVTFDVDQSGFANGITLGTQANAVLQASTSAGTYYLKCQASITNNGTIRAGTSEVVPYPSTCTFTIYLNGAYSIVCANAGYIYFYCTHPTNKYALLTQQETAATPKTLHIDPDVTGDWVVGNYINVCDISGTLPEVSVSDITAIGVGTITITSLSATKESGAYVVLRTRNIKVTGSTTYSMTNPISGSFIACEISGCTSGINGGTGYSFKGVVAGTTTFGFNGPTSCTFSGGVFVNNSYSTNSGSNGTVVSALAVGNTYSFNGGSNWYYDTVTIDGCSYGIVGNSLSRVVTSSIKHCGTAGLYTGGNTQVYDTTISNCASGAYLTVGYLFAGCTFEVNTYDLRSANSVILFDTLLDSGTEYYGYTSTAAASFNYTESINHDGETNVYKAWTKGGTISSSTIDPPTGYETWYAHACESATYACFRQYRQLVASNETLVIVGLMRIPDATDMSADPPKFQIIDFFADPLVDSSNSPLATMSIPVSNGTNTDWQDMAIAWTNISIYPRYVYVRTTATHATQQVDECIMVSDMASQVSNIYSKLPTNYIMGSSVLTDKNDEIDETIERLKRIGAYP